MKRGFLFGTMLASLAIAAEKPADFTWQAPIQISANTPYYRISLPLEAYLNSAGSNLSDVRVFNADGKVVPYALSQTSGNSENHQRLTELHWFPLRAPADAATNHSALAITVQQASDGTLVALKPAQTTSKEEDPVRAYLIDASKLGQRSSLESLELDWEGGQEGFQLLDVETSDNLRDWIPLQSGVQLARLVYQGEAIEQRKIELAGQARRYLRLQWHSPVPAPVLTRVTARQNDLQWHNPAPLWSPILKSSAAPIKLQEGDFYYSLPNAIPITRLRLNLAAGNSLFPVSILQAQRAPHPPLHLTQTLLYRINSNGKEWLQNEISLSGQPLKDFIVHIDPRALQGNTAPEVQFGLIPEQLVFLAEGKPPYQLSIGKPHANPGNLSLSTLIPGFGSAEAPQIGQATVVTDEAKQIQSAASPQADETNWKKIALWGLLIAGVLAMAAMAWQLIRQMNKS